MKTIKCKMRRTVKATAAAFTLFELLIVLAVVVILSAVAYPTIRSIVGSEYLTSGGDQVRIHFAQARNQAIRSGQTLSLRYEIAGKRYLIEPWTTGDEFLEAGMTSDTQPQVNLMGMGAVEAEPNPNHVIEKLVGQVHTLPEDITFAGSVQSFDARQSILGDASYNELTEVAGLQSATDGIAGTWSDPILFYPDGSTTQAEVRLANDSKQAFVMVRIRGLTGVTYVSNVVTVEELQQLDIQRASSQNQ